MSRPVKVDRLFAIWAIAQGASTFGADIIAVLFYEPALQLRAAKSWGFVLDNAVACLAALTLIAFASVLGLVGRAPWLIGIWLLMGFNAAQSCGCRPIFAMDAPVPKTAMFEGLCDIATGLPIYKITLGAVLLACCFMQESRLWR